MTKPTKLDRNKGGKDNLVKINSKNGQKICKEL